MKLKKFNAVISSTPEDVREDVKLSMDILDRIHELLNEKFDGKQKLLADKMGKSEAEISKWLNGVQNFTTKTLTRLAVAFGEPIIAVCTSSDHATFTQVKTPYGKENTVLQVSRAGSLKEEKIVYRSLKSKTISTADVKILAT